MNDSIAYGSIADLYDAFVTTTVDIPFFVEEVNGTPGDVLELMAGTGRLSLPLSEADATLTCVDQSSEMLERLAAKLATRGASATLFRADVRTMDLGRTFDLVILPFNSFSELIGRADQERALRTICRHTRLGGRFICTLHNPAVRLRQVDGRLRLWGTGTLDEGRERLVVTGVETLDAASGVVNGLELFEIFDRSGTLRSKRLLEIRFAAIHLQDMAEMAEAAGFEVEALYGDYDRSRFDAESSPFMIWLLRRPAASNA